MPTPSTEARAATLAADPRLVAAMPLLYVAWSDGLLSTREIGAIEQALADRSWIGAEGRAELSRWLDPEAPPSPVELEKLLATIHRAAASLSPKERRSLASLGLAIAELEHDTSGEEFHSGRVYDALVAIEKALGIVADDAVRALLHKAPWPVEDTFDERPPPFDRDRMIELMEGDSHEHWQRVRRVIVRPEFRLSDKETSKDERDEVRSWLAILARERLGALAVGEAHGGAGDMVAFLACFEALGMFDLALVVKFGVQFGLFGGSVLSLGDDALHERYLAAIARGEMLGGFAMTELGHGSNVRDIETLARYHADEGVFVLHTPSESARKEWIGNAAEDGRFMTVFAQLEVDGQRHGVHAFLVRIRQDDGHAVPGVRIEDCGRKMGLNGVDNGRLWFDQVKVPRDQLLGRFGRVDEHGRYDSPIPSAGERFFTMLGTLVGGRIGVAASANTAAKVALTVAIRYGALRRQFGPPGAPEICILDYPEHQARLFPRLAATVAFGFALRDLGQRFGRSPKSASEDRQLETLVAALKALSTRNAIDGIQACRECCGGMGFLAKNRIAKLRTDVDVFATFEGDNTVLLQLAAKSLLTDFRQRLSDDLVTTALALLTRRAADALTHRNPLGARRTDRAHLVDPEFHHNAFAYREETLLVSAARRIKRRIDDGMSPFAAFNDVQDHLLALARAFGERFVVERFAAAVGAAPAGPEREVLSKLYALYCLVRMREDLAFFAENGYVEPAKARAIRKLIVTLCRELRPSAVALVNAFGIPDNCIAAPIAFEHYVDGFRESLSAST
jgi:acyl-CoA oxidase